MEDLEGQVKRMVDILERLVDRHEILEEKINKLSESVSKMEKDFYFDDEGSDLQVICPYCANEFFVEIEDLQGDFECPGCQNIIEFNWEEEGGNSQGCNCTDCHCKDGEDNNKEDN